MLMIFLKISISLTLLCIAFLIYGHFALPDTFDELKSPPEQLHGCIVACILYFSMVLGSICWVITGFLWIWSW